MSPQISVLMSVYNGARWLRDSIPSVTGQSFQDWEFIIVNDGSSDDSAELVRAYQRVDARVVLIDKPNTGLADSLNVGIERARGRWIARLDADDVCKPDRLERQFRFASRTPNVVLVGSGMQRLDDMGRIGRTYVYPSDHDSLCRNLRRAAKFFPHSSAFFSSAAVKNVGGYRPRIKRAQDWDLWLRLSEVGSLACLEETLVLIRKHPDQVSHEDAGRRQLIDSRTAIVSHFLRSVGRLDPVAAQVPDAQFEEFRSWVHANMERRGFFEDKQFAADLKEAVHKAPSQSGRATALLGLLARKPLLCARFAVETVRGERLAERIANEWVGGAAKCAE